MTPTPDPADEAAFDAAYNALLPYTRHGPGTAWIRAELAERIVDALRDWSPFAVVEVLLADWPTGTARINRTALTEVVQAADKARRSCDQH